MTKAQQFGLVRAISYAHTLDCNQLHHSKNEQHLFNEPCPAEKRLNDDIENAYKILKELQCKRKSTKKKSTN